MRLLSFISQIESTLAMLRPEDAQGWRRRMNPQTTEALAWHPRLKLSLHLRVSLVGEGRHGVDARWLGPAGDSVVQRVFFCATAFEWQSAAETLAELMPAGALGETDEVEARLPAAAEA